jgi:ribonuclease P/MRP protein subunit RPP40
MDRSFVVRVDGAYSAPREIFSGVPQGSILGPRLFNLYVNDLLSTAKSPLAAYADDIKIWRPIENPGDVETLQLDLDNLQHWAVENKLHSNLNKCKVMHIKHNLPTTYHLGGEKLAESCVEIDLGSVITDDLNPASNIAQTVKKAFARLRFLKRNLGLFEKKRFQLVYSSLIRPLVEVNIQVIHPLYKEGIRLLESV